MVFTTRRFIFIVVLPCFLCSYFFSQVKTVITSFGEERADLYASCAFVCLSCIRSILSISHSLGVWGWLRLVIVTLPRRFINKKEKRNTEKWSIIPIPNIILCKLLKLTDFHGNRKAIIEKTTHKFLRIYIWDEAERFAEIFLTIIFTKILFCPCSRFLSL